MPKSITPAQSVTLNLSTSDVEGQTIKMQWSISCWMLQLWLACEGVSTDPGALVYSCSSGIKIQYRISSPPVDNVTGWVGYIWSFRLRAWCTQWSSTLFIGSLHHGTMKSTGRSLLNLPGIFTGESHKIPLPLSPPSFLVMGCGKWQYSPQRNKLKIRWGKITKTFLDYPLDSWGLVDSICKKVIREVREVSGIAALPTAGNKLKTASHPQPLIYSGIWKI